MANTNIGAKFYIAVDSSNNPDPQANDLADSEFAALTWVQVPNLGTHGDTGVDQNMVGYSTWDNVLNPQQKGEATGAQPEVEFLDETSTGMTAMKAAASVSDQNNYAFKVEWSDGKIEYNRGLVGAPSYPKGANEDFRRVSFPLAFNQEPVFDTA
ncbi:MAG: hypothetical protein GVY36_19240 [Verrucomicrobia bacterium]|jgi:hypothetical protein|nr:hypothetical protein [Verrucomicrobiota bacterium]